MNDIDNYIYIYALFLKLRVLFRRSLNHARHNFKLTDSFTNSIKLTIIIVIILKVLFRLIADRFFKVSSFIQDRKIAYLLHNLTFPTTLCIILSNTLDQELIQYV